MRLKQVLINLLSNAVKFSHEGGTVTVEVTAPGDGTVRIDVVDQGIGMAPEDVPGAFEAFRQLDSLLERQREDIDGAIAELKKLGATFTEVSLPNSPLSVPTYYVVAPAEASSNLARFDGVRYGHRAEGVTALEDLYSRSRAEGFGPEVQRRIMIGTYVLSHGYYDAYYLQAQKVRRLIYDDFRRVFEQVDVILGPTATDVAFKLGSKTDDPVSMYLNDIYTIAANLAGIPAMSLPCGFKDGLPVGLQLMGNFFDEAKLLNVAHQYQQVTGWHQQRPKAFE